MRSLNSSFAFRSYEEFAILLYHTFSSSGFVAVSYQKFKLRLFFEDESLKWMFFIYFLPCFDTWCNTSMIFKYPFSTTSGKCKLRISLLRFVHEVYDVLYFKIIFAVWFWPTWKFLPAKARVQKFSFFVCLLFSWQNVFILAIKNGNCF